MNLEFEVDRGLLFLYLPYHLHDLHYDHDYCSFLLLLLLYVPGMVDVMVDDPMDLCSCPKDLVGVL